MKRSREPEDGRSPATDSGQETASIISVPATRRQQQQDLPAPKIAELDESAEDQTPASHAMRCTLPGHKEPLAFRTYAEYEAHYHKAHTNRCGECRKNFPSEHLLNLHIEEAHDAFAAVLREKGERTYSCFVEACDRKCRTPQKRRMHLIDKHMYPKNYFFAVTKEGIDGRTSLLVERSHNRHHRRRSSASQAGGRPKTPASKRQESSHVSVDHPEEGGSSAEKPPAEEMDLQYTPSGKAADEERADTEMTQLTELTSAMSALQFVPTSVRFGRGKGRVGFSRR